MKLLPKTILDAITLARNLGVRFLWTDSLCIIQGGSNEAREDWARESSMMASVYGGAWLTIAASWGKTMHAGIYRVRAGFGSHGGGEIGLMSSFNPNLKGRVSLVPEHDPPDDSMDEPLYYRGWV